MFYLVKARAPAPQDLLDGWSEEEAVLYGSEKNYEVGSIKWKVAQQKRVRVRTLFCCITESTLYPTPAWCGCVMRHSMDARKSCSLGMISWKEDCVIYDLGILLKRED